VLSSTLFTSLVNAADCQVYNGPIKNFVVSFQHIDGFGGMLGLWSTPNQDFTVQVSQGGSAQIAGRSSQAAIIGFTSQGYPKATYLIPGQSDCNIAASAKNFDGIKLYQA
jgi:hypothetical protein